MVVFSHKLYKLYFGFCLDTSGQFIGNKKHYFVFRLVYLIICAHACPDLKGMRNQKSQLDFTLLLSEIPCSYFGFLFQRSCYLSIFRTCDLLDLWLFSIGMHS